MDSNLETFFFTRRLMRRILQLIVECFQKHNKFMIDFCQFDPSCWLNTNQPQIIFLNFFNFALGGLKTFGFQPQQIASSSSSWHSLTYWNLLPVAVEAETGLETSLQHNERKKIRNFYFVKFLWFSFLFFIKIFLYSNFVVQGFFVFFLLSDWSSCLASVEFFRFVRLCRSEVQNIQFRIIKVIIKSVKWGWLIEELFQRLYLYTASFCAWSVELTTSRFVLAMVTNECQIFQFFSPQKTQNSLTTSFWWVIST